MLGRARERRSGAERSGASLVARPRRLQASRPAGLASGLRRRRYVAARSCPRCGEKWLTTPMNRHTVARSGTGEGLPRRRLVTHGRAADPLRRDLSTRTGRQGPHGPARQDPCAARRDRDGRHGRPLPGPVDPRRLRCDRRPAGRRRSPPARPSARCCRSSWRTPRRSPRTQQGRVVIPQVLRTYAGLGSEVVVNGAPRPGRDLGQGDAGSRSSAPSHRGPRGRRRRARHLRRAADLALTGT